MIEFIVTADRSEGVVSIQTPPPEGWEKGQDGVIVLDVADALFLARRLLEEIGTFEGLSR